MFEGQLFTVIAINGSFLDVDDPNVDSLRFDGLNWEDAVSLARLSFDQGFEIVVWRTEDEEQCQTAQA